MSIVKSGGAPSTKKDELDLLQRFVAEEGQSKYVKKGVRRDSRSGARSFDSNRKDGGNDSGDSGSARDEVKRHDIGWFPQLRIALLPNTAGHHSRSGGGGSNNQLLGTEVMDHPVLASIRNAFAPSTISTTTAEGSGIALFGQIFQCEKGITSRLSSAISTHVSRSGNSSSSSAKPAALVVSRSLESLLPLAQALPLQVRDHFVFVRATDPYFALLHCCPDRYLRRVVVNFPAPCPSDQESYRRVVHARFLALVHQKLARGGDVVVTTDYSPLHRFHCDELVRSEASSVSWAAPRQQQQQQQLGKKGNASSSSPSLGADASSSDSSNVLDVATMPSLDDAPPHVKFALEMKGAGKADNTKQLYTLRRFKDSETSEIAVAQNASFVSSRQRFGALVKN